MPGIRVELQSYDINGIFEALYAQPSLAPIPHDPQLAEYDNVSSVSSDHNDDALLTCPFFFMRTVNGHSEYILVPHTVLSSDVPKQGFYTCTANNFFRLKFTGYYTDTQMSEILPSVQANKETDVLMRSSEPQTQNVRDLYIDFCLQHYADFFNSRYLYHNMTSLEPLNTSNWLWIWLKSLLLHAFVTFWVTLKFTDGGAWNYGYHVAGQGDDNVFLSSFMAGFFSATYVALINVIATKLINIVEHYGFHRPALIFAEIIRQTVELAVAVFVVNFIWEPIVKSIQNNVSDNPYIVAAMIGPICGFAYLLSILSLRAFRQDCRERHTGGIDPRGVGGVLTHPGTWYTTAGFMAATAYFVAADETWGSGARHTVLGYMASAAVMFPVELGRSGVEAVRIERETRNAIGEMVDELTSVASRPRAV